MRLAVRTGVLLFWVAGSAVAMVGCSSHGDEAPNYVYDVPVSSRSPSPMMRLTRRNDGLSPILPARASSGGEPWRFSTAKGIFSVPVIGGDGTVLVGSADRSFYAVRPDGTLKWSFPTGEIIDSAAAVGADEGTVIDPDTPSLVAMDGVVDGASFTADGQGLVLVTGGPPIELESFRIAAQLDASGRFDVGTSVFAQAGCSDLGAVGLFLRLFSLCNRDGDFVAAGTIRGAPYDGAANRRPAGVRVAGVRLSEDRRRVEASFDAQGYPLAEHLPAIVLVDAASDGAIQMNYREALSSMADGNGDLATATLALPAVVALEPGRPVRAIVVTDLFPLTSVLLE